MSLPALSVAMSAFNGERFLAPAIESVLAQTFADFEFLILDDGSSDGTRAIIESYAARDGRIRPILRENRGLVASLNQLIEEAQAPLIARMDADDICLPERFARQMAFLEANPDYGVVGSWCQDIDENGRPWPAASLHRHPTDHAGFITAIRLGLPLLCHPAVMYRRDLVRSVGGYHAAFRHCEDLDLWLRLASITKIASLPDELVKYRHYAQQVSSRHATEQQVGAAVARLAYAERLAHRPDPTAELASLPELDGLDALFGREGVSRAVRAQVAPGLLYSSAALRGDGFDLVLRYLREGGAHDGMWRTVLRLVRFGEAGRAIRLASTLATHPTMREKVPAPAAEPNDGGREAATMTVRGAAVWAMGGQYLSFAIQFVTSVIISRYLLSPSEVGLFSIAMAAALLASVLQDFGLSRYIAGLPRIDNAQIARCSSVAHAFSMFVAGVIAAAAWPMAAAYKQPDLLPIMLIIASSYLFIPFAVVPMALLGRTMSFRGHFLINVGSALAQGAVALGCAAAGFSSFALAWGALAFGIARGAIAQWLKPALPWPLSIGGLGPIVSTGSRLTTLYAIGAAGSRSPDLIVGKALGLLAVGLYSRAASLADQFRTLIAGAIGSVFYPAFARIRDRGDPLGPAYLRVCAGYSAVVWPGMAGLALAAEPVVRLLYGETWSGVGPLLAMIALSEILLVSLPLHTDLPILTGKLGPLIRVNFIDTVLAITLLLAGTRWGLVGAAASRLAYGACWILLYARFMHRVVGFDVRALLAIYLRSALATLAALVPLALTYALWLPPERIGLGPLAFASGLGVLLWLAALMLTGHPAWRDISGILHEGALPLLRRRRAAPAR